MKPRTFLLMRGVLLGCVTVAGCGRSSLDVDEELKGGVAGSGGFTGTSLTAAQGGSTATGGRTTSLGGLAATGGQATGGLAATGGQAAGGLPGTGGSPLNTGGVAETGGATLQTGGKHSTTVNHCDILDGVGARSGVGGATSCPAGQCDPSICAPELGSPQLLSMAKIAVSVNVGDLNRDTLPDLITSHLDNTVSVRLGTGWGTFADAVSYPVGRNPGDVAVGDVNGDCWPDLVTCNFNSTYMSVLLGSGNGLLGSAQHYEVGSFCEKLALSDMDGDGALDIVASLAGPNRLAVLMNEGSGTFSSPVDYRIDGHHGSVTVADLNGDGYPDAALPGVGYTAILLFNNGDGSLGNPQYQGVGGDSVAINVGDVNNDGHVDLVVVNMQLSTLDVMLGNGIGGFLLTRSDVLASDLPNNVVLGDWNADGRLDLAITRYWQSSVAFRMGKGDGSFEPETISVGAYRSSVATRADVDGDGRSDLVIANGTLPALTFVRAGGASPFDSHIADATVKTGAKLVVTGDFDRDGTLDSAVAGDATGDIEILTKPLGTTLQVRHTISAGYQVTALQAADMNGDGLLDLITGAGATDGFTVFFGAGNGEFKKGPSVATTSVDSIQAGDLNGDKIQDLVIGSYRNDKNILPFFGTSAGNYVSASAYNVTKETIKSILLRDVDGDQRADLLVASANSDAGHLFVSWGRGDGTFSDPSAISAYYEQGAIVAADINGDNQIDIATALPEERAIAVWLSTGNRAFAQPVLYSVSSKPGRLLAGDFNGDNYADLVTIEDSPGVIDLFSGVGNGTLAPLVRFNQNAKMDGVAAGDMDGDGRLDLISVQSAGVVSVISNVCSPRW